MAKKTEAPKTLLEMLVGSGGIQFHTQWSDKTMYVDNRGVLRIGNPKFKTANDVRYIRGAQERGVIEHMPNELYHRERMHVSSSALKVFDENVRKYHRIYVKREALADDGDPSSSKRIGSIAHSLILDDPGVTETLYAVEPTEAHGLEIKRRTNDGKQYLADWKAAMIEQGIEPCTQKEWDMACDLANAVGQDDLAMQMVCHEEAVKEVSLFSYDEESGQRIKARIDLLTRMVGGTWDGHPAIVDIKTSESSSPDEFTHRDVRRFGYDISGGIYRKVFKSITGVLPRFVWLVLSKDKQGDTQAFLTTISDNDWMDAEIAVNETLDRIAKANLKDEFVSPFLNKITVTKLKR